MLSPQGPFPSEQGKEELLLTTKVLNTQKTHLLQQTGSLRAAESSWALCFHWDVMGFVSMKGGTSSEEQRIFLIKRN